MIDFKGRLKNVELIAHSSKLKRLFNNPLKYFFAIGHRRIIYPFFKKGIIRSAKLFYGKKMEVLLPAGTDIYLTGGKSHDSEIRLAKFILNNLNQGDIFFDVGAHLGYYTLLASEIVGPNGKVFTFEASKITYSLLQRNVKHSRNIRTFNNAVSDSNDQLEFYELPVLYSEYSSIDTKQYQNQKWFLKNAPKSYKINGINLHDVSDEHHAIPKMIKIDVEGAEYKVLMGSYNLLTSYNCIIVMEYLSKSRGNTEHNKSKDLLEELGYSCFKIDHEGALLPEDNIDNYLLKNNLESDNLVFMKNQN